jgi:uncharacterized membrane protein YkoI
MDRRLFMFGVLALALVGQAELGHAKDGDSGGGGGNSGSGSGNSDSGNSGDDDDDRDDDRDDDGDDDRDDNDREDDRRRDKELRKRAEDAVKKGDIAPVSEILKAAKANTPGKVVDVKLNRRFLNYVYRVRILTPKGRRAELTIDAKSKRILQVR